MFLFDRDRKLRYVGRIDDAEVKPLTSQDLRNALDALLAGKPVSVEKTRTFGCSTKWSDKRADAKTWLEKADHRAGAIARPRRRRADETRPERHRQAVGGQCLGHVVRTVRRRAARAGRR
ncbi:MAG: hypothetical protein QM811_08620 [Pirellulales bacterium]